jgi:hypothetical protein
MPIYEYACPKTDEHEEHMFELIRPVSEVGKPQQCPTHNCECQAVEFSKTGDWVWGMNDIHWSAGLGSNSHGMSGAKKV